MSIICPTITAQNTHQYRDQVERVESFARIIHVDIMDGVFVKTQSPGIAQIWWPKNLQAHLHLMVENPLHILQHAIDLNPEMIIVHAEADMSEVIEVLMRLKHTKIKSGLAILSDTDPDADDVFGMLSMADHALVFSGHLGYQGGKANMDDLAKVKKIHQNFPDITIGWDGGINDKNIAKLKKAGVDYFNVGGYIQKSENPTERFNQLGQIIK